ncbi:phage antirepressor KilAC domain-containing protein [Leptotrichia sp.]
MYIRDDVWQEIMNDPKRFGELLIDYAETKKEKERLAIENKQKDQLIAEYEPKVNYCDLVLASPNLVSISLIAKDYGMSAIAFNKLLHDLGIQYKLSGTWLLYQKYANFGYTKSTTYIDENTGFSRLNTKWTQKGRLFIYETLKANGILPIIEKN